MHDPLHPHAGCRYSSAAFRLKTKQGKKFCRVDQPLKSAQIQLRLAEPLQDIAKADKQINKAKEEIVVAFDQKHRLGFFVLVYQNDFSKDRRGFSTGGKE
jgi:hypothetical protein